ncbi:MAG: DUF413 domain-containing protein [Bacteroidota bacterium]
MQKSLILKKHLELLGKPLSCSFMKPILTKEEYTFLRKHGKWMRALYKKEIPPLSHKQKRYCEELWSGERPEDELALIFWKYLHRKQLIQRGKLEKIRSTGKLKQTSVQSRK